MKAAVIDVGFNSMKMVRYRVEPDGLAKAYGQLGALAKLGEGLEKTGYLGNEPISRTLRAKPVTISFVRSLHPALVPTSLWRTPRTIKPKRSSPTFFAAPASPGSAAFIPPPALFFGHFCHFAGRNCAPTCDKRSRSGAKT